MEKAKLYYLFSQILYPNKPSAVSVWDRKSDFFHSFRPFLRNKSSWVMVLNVLKKHWDCERDAVGGCGLVSNYPMFFNMHLNLSTQAFSYSAPRHNSDAVAGHWACNLVLSSRMPSRWTAADKCSWSRQVESLCTVKCNLVLAFFFKSSIYPYLFQVVAIRICASGGKCQSGIVVHIFLLVRVSWLTKPRFRVKLTLILFRRKLILADANLVSPCLLHLHNH